MLNILGIGSAYGATLLDNSTLSAIDKRFQDKSYFNRTGIESRYTTLPLDYIKQTGNRDPRGAPTAALQTPTDLAFQATISALERAEVQPEKIGLIVGETCTPIQSTPSEGQRIGKRLNIKVPAYDLAAAEMTLWAQLSALSKWKANRLESYALCLSANTPTQNICYGSEDSDNDAPFLFGDAACTLVVSAQHPGKLSVLESGFVSLGPNGIVADLPTYGCGKGSIENWHTVIGDKLEKVLVQLVSANGQEKLDRLRIIATPSDGIVLERLARAANLPVRAVLQNVTQRGDSFGSSAGSVLADNWEKFGRGEEIVVVQSGYGGVG
ncbi:MAG: hypothetical protein DCC75_07920, partial [Proteobacteria bacterium]